MIFCNKEKELDHSACESKMKFQQDIIDSRYRWAEDREEELRNVRKEMTHKEEVIKDLQYLYDTKSAHCELMRQENDILRNLLGLKDSPKVEKRKYNYTGKYKGHHKKYHSDRNKVETK